MGQNPTLPVTSQNGPLLVAGLYFSFSGPINGRCQVDTPVVKRVKNTNRKRQVKTSGQTDKKFTCTRLNWPNNFELLGRKQILLDSIVQKWLTY